MNERRDEGIFKLLSQPLFLGIKQNELADSIEYVKMFIDKWWRELKNGKT